MATTPDLLLINKAVAFWAVHGVNTYGSKVGSVGSLTAVFLTGLGMLLEIHPVEFPERLAKVHSLVQLHPTEPGRRRQRGPRAPAGAGPGQPQRREPGTGRAGLGVTGCYQGY